MRHGDGRIRLRVFISVLVANGKSFHFGLQNNPFPYREGGIRENRVAALLRHHGLLYYLLIRQNRIKCSA